MCHIISTVIIPKILYKLQLTIPSRNWLARNIEIPLKKAAKQAMHLPRNTPDTILYDSNYGTHFLSTQTQLEAQEITNALVHYRSNKNSGTILRLALQSVEKANGLLIPLLEAPVLKLRTGNTHNLAKLAHLMLQNSSHTPLSFRPLMPTTNVQNSLVRLLDHNEYLKYHAPLSRSNLTLPSLMMHSSINNITRTRQAKQHPLY